MAAYYNEIDPFAAQWLRNLINAGHIAPGDVDERSIEDVRPDDLAGYTQCHFFAGIGVWSYALRKAGWSDDRPVWTGSCPCQPFSAAGKGAGFADERHLWPAWFHLISQCRPSTVLGEQVASKDGLGWLDLVSADMEGAGYAFGAADLCAAGVGAPHIRQRLWFTAQRLADTGSAAGERYARSVFGTQAQEHGTRFAIDGGMPVGYSDGGADGGMADADDAGLEGRREPGRERAAERALGAGGVAGRLGNPNGAGQQARDGIAVGGEARPEQHADTGAHGGLADSERNGQHRSGQAGPSGRGELADGGIGDHRPGPTNGLWRDADWLYCRDGKWRPVEPGTFPLAHGATSRVGRLRAYGNAICSEAAETFIRCVA